MAELDSGEGAVIMQGENENHTSDSILKNSFSSNPLR